MIVPSIRLLHSCGDFWIKLYITTSLSNSWNSFSVISPRLSFLFMRPDIFLYVLLHVPQQNAYTLPALLTVIRFPVSTPPHILHTPHERASAAFLAGCWGR